METESQRQTDKTLQGVMLEIKQVEKQVPTFRRRQTEERWMETLNDLTKTENTDEITDGTDHGRAGRRWKTRRYPEEGTTEEKKKGKPTQQEGLNTQRAAKMDLIR